MKNISNQIHFSTLAILNYTISTTTEGIIYTILAILCFIVACYFYFKANTDD